APGAGLGSQRPKAAATAARSRRRKGLLRAPWAGVWPRRKPRAGAKAGPGARPNWAMASRLRWPARRATTGRAQSAGQGGRRPWSWRGSGRVARTSLRQGLRTDSPAEASRRSPPEPYPNPLAQQTPTWKQPWARENIAPLSVHKNKPQRGGAIWRQA